MRATGALRVVRKPLRQLRDFGASPSVSANRNSEPSTLISRQPVIVTDGDALPAVTADVAASATLVTSDSTNVLDKALSSGAVTSSKRTLSSGARLNGFLVLTGVDFGVFEMRSAVRFRWEEGAFGGFSTGAALIGASLLVALAACVCCGC